jgi:hypothetical protein
MTLALTLLAAKLAVDTLLAMLNASDATKGPVELLDLATFPTRRESRSLPASIDDARFVCAVMAKALDGMEVAYDPPDEFRIWRGGNGLSASELGSWRGLSTGTDVHQIRGSSDQR